MDDDDLALVTAAAAAAAEAAVRKEARWRMVPATIIDFSLATFQAGVLVDGSEDPILAYVAVGVPLRSGDRVFVTFTPPAGAVVTGFVGVAPAVLGLWYSGGTTAIDPYWAEYLPWPVVDSVSHEELFLIEGNRIYTNIEGWFRVDATIYVGAAESTVDIMAYEPNSGGRGYRGSGTGTGYVTASGPVYMDAANYIQVQVSNKTGSTSTAFGGVLVSYLGA